MVARRSRPKSSREGQPQPLSKEAPVSNDHSDAQADLFRLGSLGGPLRRFGDERLTRLIAVGAEIAAAPPSYKGSRNFFQVGFASVHLPVNRTEDRSWEVRNGNVILHMTAGRSYNPDTDTLEEIGLPYGPRSRQILIYLQTKAVLSNTPVIEVGRSLRQFIASLMDRPPQDSDYAQVREQLRRLAATNIDLVYRAEGETRQLQSRFVKEVRLWTPEGARNWQEKLVLTDDFYQALRASPVPLDSRAVAELRNSALSLDIYQWIAHRLFGLEGNRRDLVPWVSLKEQFGRQVFSMTKFRQTFLENLRKVQEVYPGAKQGVEVTGRGLILSPAPPPVPSIVPMIG